MPCTLGGRPCVDPAELIAACGSQVPPVPVDRWSARAGVYTTGPGPMPGRGAVLMRRADMDRLTLTSDLTLTFVGCQPRRTVALHPVTVLSRECVTPGGPDDPNAAFVVDVADRRHLLRMIPFDRAFNVTKADGSGYYTGTLNSGVAWTWQEIATNIATALGISITLPFTPHGTPENLVYWGHASALECLCDLLDRLACALTYDPTEDAFGAVQLGAAGDTDLDLVADPKVWDGAPTSYARAWRPEKVRVRFPRRPVDSTNWNTPYYTVDVTLAAESGVKSGTLVQLEDGMSALAATGTPSNSAALALRAQERADDWLLKREFYERRALVAWRDFVPDAAGLGGAAVRRVVFDDRYESRTWAETFADGLLEKWKPLGGWPVWWPGADVFSREDEFEDNAAYLGTYSLLPSGRVAFSRSPEQVLTYVTSTPELVSIIRQTAGTYGAGTYGGTDFQIYSERAVVEYAAAFTTLLGSSSIVPSGYRGAYWSVKFGPASMVSQGGMAIVAYGDADGDPGCKGVVTAYYISGLGLETVTSTGSALLKALDFGFKAADYFSGDGSQGLTGAIGPGAAAKDGLLTTLGSGSFGDVTAAGTNSFSGANSFSSTTTFTGTVASQNAATFTPASAATVPVTIQGAASQIANILEGKTNGGSVVASISAAGAITGTSLNGPYDAGTW